MRSDQLQPDLADLEDHHYNQPDLPSILRSQSPEGVIHFGIFGRVVPLMVFELINRESCIFEAL